jgi:catechol 2,3-dioxygenase-like lactoylglutathione lyase family enzyme
MTTYKAKYLSPMIPSFNIEKTASFFTDLLDFKVRRDEKTYVILYKDHVTVHILRAGADTGEMEFYFEVNDIEDVWNNMKDKLGGVKFKEPFNQEYGMREVHVIIPETKTLMFIGQVIS